MARILILANHYNTLRIFRRELIQELSRMGHEVTVSLPACDDENRMQLESYGCSVRFLRMERRGKNPLKDLEILLQYRKLIREIQPEKVITYTIKPNIYGSLVCKRMKIPHYVNVTGLGSTFQRDNFLRKLVSFMYRCSMNKADMIFFENEGNRDTLVNEGIVRLEQTIVMPGAGVNLEEFAVAPYPKKECPTRFLFIGRIMREKGVDEYFEAITEIREEYPEAEFHFIGWYEDHYEAQVQRLQEEGFIHFHGFQPDVKPFIREACCIVLPSWHEGMSNTLLEASAMGRPIISSRIHGCMEAVEEGVNGFLTDKKSAASILKSLRMFLALSYEERVQMGINGRKRMEEMFDKKMVVQRTIDYIFKKDSEDVS